MTAEKVGLRLRRLFWLLATACMISYRRDMLKPVALKLVGQDQSVSIRRAYAVWQDVPVMLTVKHHTAEFMLQHGVSAERIGLLAPLRLRRRNMGTLNRSL